MVRQAGRSANNVDRMLDVGTVRGKQSAKTQQLLYGPRRSRRNIPGGSYCRYV